MLSNYDQDKTNDLTESRMIDTRRATNSKTNQQNNSDCANAHLFSCICESQSRETDL
jgi:hypothetical protein